MSQRIVAICGKGGVGKTTVSSIIARAFARSTHLRTLMVDADHAGGLGMALALSVKQTLNDVRVITIAEIQSGTADKRDLAASVDYRLMEAIVEIGNLAFLSVGRPEEEGCYCSVHSLLREAIEMLAGKFDRTVIDAEAGIEQLNRKVMTAVDTLILVSDATAKGIRVAETIAQVAQNAGVGAKKTGLLINRVRSESEALEMKNSTGLAVLGTVPEDDTIRDFDRKQISLLDLPDCPAVLAVQQALAFAGIL